MITLHHLQHSRSMRILWALEELGIDYDLRYYERLPTMAAPLELKKVHPLGKAPVITDDDTVVAESAVILDYLQQKYDSNHQFKPADKKQQFDYQYWMHYAEGSLMPLLVFTLVTNRLGGKPVPLVLRPLTRVIGDQLQSKFSRPRLREHMDYLEQHLAKNKYFVGDRFSFADIQMTLPLQALVARQSDVYLPHTEAFLKRVSERTAFYSAQHVSPDKGELTQE